MVARKTTLSSFLTTKETSGLYRSTQGGTQIVDQAGLATSYDDPTKAPSAPYAIEQAQIDKDFAAVLKAPPEAPVHFTLQFFSDSARLKPVSEPEIAKVLEMVKSRNAPDVSVIGHSDSAGNEAYNHRLALRRAKAIFDMLVKAGVDPNRIDVSSHGENNPVVKTPDNTREPKNRRVEVTVR